MTQLNTTIVSAIVYPDRVRLTRRGSINLKPGTHDIEIPELPLSLNPDSLRASVYGSANARLLGVQVKLEAADPKPTEQTELNQLIWSFSLEPKEKRTVRFDFSIESPQAMKIISLP
jgi:hypothetical protein